MFYPPLRHHRSLRYTLLFLFYFFVRFIYFVLCARAKRFSRAEKYALFNCQPACQQRYHCRRDLIKIAESTSKKHV